MNKFFKLSLIFSFSMPLVSCSPKTTKYLVHNIMTVSTKTCNKSGEDDVLCVDNGESVSPFDSGIKLKFYHTKDTSEATLNKLTLDFTNRMAYYSAVFDRHYNYQYRNEEGEMKWLFNLRAFNAKIVEVHTTGESSTVKVPDILYEGMKEAYEFSLNSGLKYNLAVGALSNLYSDSIEKATKDAPTDKNPFSQSSVDNLAIFGADFSANDLSNAMKATPNTVQLSKLITFNDDKTITINKVMDVQEVYPSITLSGYAKGEAEDVFSALYPTFPFLFDGGTSSIKTQNIKLDGSKWKITITNPLFNEETAYLIFPHSPLNPSDFYFESDKDFILSTSGYYNNYYYTFDDSNALKLRHHIVNSTTGQSESYFDSTHVFSSKSGRADMFSTALMNCSSLEEAEGLRVSLNAIYKEEAVAFYTRHEKTLPFKKNDVIAYIPKSLSRSFKLMSKSDVDKSLVTKFVTF